MSQHALNVRLQLKPCKNIKFYYFEVGEGRTIIGSLNKVYIKNLSALPASKNLDDVYIEWETVDARPTTEAKTREVVQATEELLRRYLPPLAKGEQIDLRHLLDFAAKYCWPFEQASGVNSCNLDTIKESLHGALTIKYLLDFRWRETDKFLRNLLDNLKAASNHKRDVILTNYYRQGFMADAAESKGLHLHIRYTSDVREAIADDLEDLRHNSSHVPAAAHSMLASEALASVMKYITDHRLEWRAVWNGGSIGFEAIISSPLAYCLLQTKRPALLSKKQSDQRYSKTPYAQLSNYLRSRQRGGHITKEEYSNMLEEGRRLLAISPFSYEELRQEVLRTFKEEVK